MKKIFISCVSSEFKTLRIDAALALKGGLYEPVFQEDFNFEPTSLKESLRKKIKSCVGIIHIVGDGYGAEFPTNDPECNPNGNISYTQWELRLVEEMNRKSFRKKGIWLIFPGDDCTRDTAIERLDWVDHPDLTHAEATQIQEWRRHLQITYKDELYAQRSQYAYRTPQNDREFKKVLETIVKKEHSRQVKAVMPDSMGDFRLRLSRLM